jgi:FXSXX-COOH protein
MQEDAGDHGGGPLDLSGLPLSDIADIPGSVLDRELARLLARGDLGEEAAGFQSRV